MRNSRSNRDGRRSNSGRERGRSGRSDRRGFAAMDENRRREIGRMGGETVRDEYGPNFYREIGRRGGEAVRDEYGPEFYREIGRREVRQCVMNMALNFMRK